MAAKYRIACIKSSYVYYYQMPADAVSLCDWLTDAADVLTINCSCLSYFMNKIYTILSKYLKKINRVQARTSVLQVQKYYLQNKDVLINSCIGNSD